MSSAILPESLEEETIDSMMTGEAAHTVPWAMWVDAERHCWLHPGYTASDHPHGTVSMRVELREDGYHVWPSAGEKWGTQERPGYVGSEGVDFLPVTELHIK